MLKKIIAVSLVICSGGILMSGCNMIPLDKIQRKDSKAESVVSEEESKTKEKPVEKTESSDTSVVESSHVVESSSEPESSVVSEESEQIDPAAMKNLQDIKLLLEKKHALQEENCFVKVDPENEYIRNTYYYCDAVVKDFNHDGNYEMIVKYVVPLGLAGSTPGELDYQTHEFKNASTVYDLFTVQDGIVVSSDYLDIQHVIHYGSQL